MTRRTLLALVALPLFCADDTPQWLRAASAMPVPAYPPGAAVVILLQEERLSIEPDGKRVMRERGAAKCLASSGRCRIAAVRHYNSKTGRIRDFRGWLLTASGKEIRYGKDRIADTNPNDDSAETRSRVLDPGDDFRPGAVFAWEAIEEERTVFTQVLHSFQQAAPVLVSRYITSLPAGWELRSTVFNRENLQPVISGNTHTWEMRNLPWIEPEEHGPGYQAIVPRLAITFFPPSDASALRALKDWAAVSSWIAELVAPRSAVTPAILAKASQLTVGAADDLAKIRAIAAFVQQTKYVSIQMNLTRGGGYTPQRADDVLTRNYGDCKDKANLMHTLLKGVGIQSYLTAIFSGAREFVRPEWPSTYQFNHMIVAVHAPAGVNLPTVVEHPNLGRLLFFDPTDPYTPVGDLDVDQQGSYALVIAGGEGVLLKMPLLPASTNRVETETRAEMTVAGGISATAVSNYYGHAASGLRGMISRQSPDELRRGFESVLTRTLGGSKLNDVLHAEASGSVRLTLTFEAGHFGQIMQDRLLILNPGALAGASVYSFPARERKLPVKLSAEFQKDRVSVKVPAGFTMDELPDRVTFMGPYGSYSAAWKFSSGEVVFEQSLEVNDITAPPDDYAHVRGFFERVARASQAGVVLVKK